VRMGQDMLIYSPRSDSEQQAFLARRHGTIVQNRQHGYATTTVVRVDTNTQDLDDFAYLAELIGLKGRLIFSSEGAARLYNMILEEGLDGLHLTFNPQLMFAGEPITIEDHNLAQTFEAWWANSSEFWLDRAWVLAHLMDVESEPVDIAVVDGGFQAGADVPDLVDGHDYEDGDDDPFGENPVSCSGDSSCTWHGAWVWGVAGGTLNNGADVAGVGGQVARPMFYRIGFSNWLFDIGDVIDRAVANGAQVINFSGGFPCSLDTDLGTIPLCDPGERGDLCEDVAVGLALAVLLGVPVPPEIVLALSIFALPLDIYCFSDFNPMSEMEDAVLRANEQGAVVVAAAGNEVRLFHADYGPWDVGAIDMVPCVVDGVICVGELEDDFSGTNNWGALVDLWAPSGMPRSGDVGTEFHGTSASTPYISGLAALMMGINPDLTPNEVAEILVDTANEDSPDAHVHHYVNPYEALWDAADADPDRGADMRDVVSYCPDLGWDETHYMEDNDGVATAPVIGNGAGPLSHVANAAVHDFNDPADVYQLDLPADVAGRAYEVNVDFAYSDRAGVRWPQLSSPGATMWPGSYILDVSDVGCYELGGDIDAIRINPDACEVNDTHGQACLLNDWESVESNDWNVWEQERSSLNFHVPTDLDFFTAPPPPGAPAGFAEDSFCQGLMGQYTFELQPYDTLARFTGVFNQRGDDHTDSYRRGVGDALPNPLHVQSLSDYSTDGVWLRVEGDLTLVHVDGYWVQVEHEAFSQERIDDCDYVASRIRKIAEGDTEAGGSFWWLEAEHTEHNAAEFLFPFRCPPPKCDPAKLPYDFMGFFWDVAGDLIAEMTLPADRTLHGSLLDVDGNVLGEFSPLESSALAAQSSPAASTDIGKLEQKLSLRLSDVQPGIYLLKIGQGDFGTHYTLSVYNPAAVRYLRYMPLLVE